MRTYGTLGTDDQSERSSAKEEAIQLELGLRRLKRHPYAWHAKLAIGTSTVLICYQEKFKKIGLKFLMIIGCQCSVVNVRIAPLDFSTILGAHLYILWASISCIRCSSVLVPEIATPLA